MAAAAMAVEAMAVDSSKREFDFLLAGAASKAMGYPKTSLLRLHMQNAEKEFKRGGGRAAAQWIKDYHVGARKVLSHVGRLPMGAQRAVHNHILHTLTKGNPDLNLAKTGHVNDFVKDLKGIHDALARHFGIKTTLGSAPKIVGMLQKALSAPGAPGTLPGPNAGVNTAGIPRPEAKAAERGALGMNPMPPAMRHPTPLSMAPGPAGMPGAKALGAPPLPPMSGQAPGGLHG
jgi:hypothetical protein